MSPSPSHVALVVSDSGRVEMKTVPTKQLRNGEILVSPLKVGICGTDLQIIRRIRSDTATILGHEGVAEIIKVGSGVSGFSLGQIVTFNPVNPYSQNDILGHSTEGLFQQRLSISQSALEHGLIVPFDSRIPLLCGPLVEPLGTVIYGQLLVERASHPRSIAIVGAGPIGLLHALYARVQGLSDIFLVHNSQERLRWAVERNIINANETALSSPELACVLLERTSGHGVDAAYLCTTRPGALDALTQALKYVRVGGCINLVGGFSDGDTHPSLPGIELNSIRRANFCGYPQDGATTRCFTLEGKEIRLTGHRGTSEHHLRTAMELLCKHCIHYSRVISHIISLQAAPLILEDLATAHPRQTDGKECVKVIIDFTAWNQVVEIYDPQQLFSLAMS